MNDLRKQKLLSEDQDEVANRTPDDQVSELFKNDQDRRQLGQIYSTSQKRFGGNLKCNWKHLRQAVRKASEGTWSIERKAIYLDGIRAATALFCLHHGPWDQKDGFKYQQASLNFLIR
ncbi:uncharacterized protein RBU33_027229 isoform 1-T1 [Hipposideros larvatus]